MTLEHAKPLFVAMACLGALAWAIVAGAHVKDAIVRRDWSDAVSAVLALLVVATVVLVAIVIARAPASG